MKTSYRHNLKFAAFLLLFYSSSLFPQNTNICSYSWASQTSGTTSLLYSVKAVNEMVCWTAGSAATVRRTTDGGLTWLNGNPNPGVVTGNILNIDAVDENNAWITTSPATNTFIYRTTNGGSSWTQVYNSTGGFIFGINMISATIGFAFGDPVGDVWRIHTTTDGGITWGLMSSSPSAQISETGIENCFQVALPFMWFGTSLGKIYRTTNNGINWTVHTAPGINIYVLAIHFNSLSLGLASSTAMVKSTDAGSTYVPQTALGAGNITSIEGSGSDFWYLRGSSIYRSTNGGDNWLLEHNAATTMLHFDIPDNSNGCLKGWAVGYAGTIAKMTGIPVGISNNHYEIPNKYSLEQNYPNPFNPQTEITIALPESGQAELKVFDIFGREVSNLLNAYTPAGYHTFKFDAVNLSSGVYFCTLKTRAFTNTKKMLLVK